MSLKSRRLRSSKRYLMKIENWINYIKMHQALMISTPIWRIQLQFLMLKRKRSMIRNNLLSIMKCWMMASWFTWKERRIRLLDWARGRESSLELNQMQVHLRNQGSKLVLKMMSLVRSMNSSVEQSFKAARRNLCFKISCSKYLIYSKSFLLFLRFEYSSSQSFTSIAWPLIFHNVLEDSMIWDKTWMLTEFFNC